MIGQEGYTRFLAKITYTHQAADQSHLSEAYCTRLHPYTSSAEGMKLARSTKVQAPSSLIGATPGHTILRPVELKIICRETWLHYSPLILE